MPLPHRIQAIQSPIIPIVGEWIRDHPGTLSLGQGVVYYGPPPQAIERLSGFLSDPENHRYRPVEGIPELVRALEEKLCAENGIVVGEESAVVVTAGGNMAFANAVLAITDPGDEIVLPTPYYFNPEMAITMADCRPVLVPTDARYQLHPDAVEAAITERTRAVVTVSPNNPSGAVYPEPVLRRINAICRERGIYHISDEAYEYFTYGDARPFSPGSIPGSAAHTISLYSLSKAYGFASWRIGYMVLPSSLRAAVKKIQDTILICPPVVSQHAALGALEAGRDWCRERHQSIAEVRDLVLEELEGLGELCSRPPADGAFYVLLKVDTPLSAMETVERLIREHRVAVIPGTTFGLHDGCYLRIAYGALRKETVAEGMERLIRGLKGIAGGSGG